MNRILQEIEGLPPEKRELFERLLKKKGLDGSTALGFTRTQDDRLLPMSFAQERLAYLDQLFAGNSAYNIPVAIRLAGKVNAQALLAALNEIVRRHDSLRTTGSMAQERPMQRIAASMVLSMPMVDCSSLAQEEGDSLAIHMAGEEAAGAFSLADGPLLRATLFQITDQDHIFLLTTHHFVADGWSLQVLFQELVALYEVFYNGSQSPLHSLRIQYADFARWQRRQFDNGAWTGQLDYWKHKLPKDSFGSKLPTDHQSPAVREFRGSAVAVALTPSLTGALQGLCRRERTTLFPALFAAFDALVFRYTSQYSVTVGTATSNRNYPGTDDLIATLANNLVLHLDFSPEATFFELLAQARETFLEALAHQDLPFEKLVEELQTERQIGYNPLFQIMLVLHETRVQNLRLQGLSFSPLPVHTRASRLDLTLEMTVTGDEITAVLEYNAGLFERVTIQRLAEHFLTLLDEVTRDPALPLYRLGLLTSTQRQQLAAEWNDTDTHFDGFQGIHEMFQAQAKERPDSIVLSFDDSYLSYLELNTAANRFAHFLLGSGAGPGSIVAVCQSRSFDLLVSILAVLKAGAAYLPIDPSYPEQRISLMVDDASATLLLTDRPLAPTLSNGATPVIDVNGAPGLLARYPGHNPGMQPFPDGLAYVIFTSGSTGRPKGVMVSHRAATNRLLWMQAAYNLSARDSVLQKTPITFDVSVWELFWPSLAGARLVIARPGGHQEPSYLAALIVEQAITVAHFVPSLLRVFLDEPDLKKCRSLRHVFCSGEALNYSLAAEFGASGLPTKLHNLY
ncbi:MAG TPA: condensation domain-containing protein, partial [Blastocatellia bacterium]|nr:condensation domain-containing protein [Blastocatellia bacterium]